MPERVLITGATSFLGGRLIERLIERQTDAHALTRPSSDTAGLPEPVTVHVHDSSMDGARAIMAAARPDAVFHLATLYLRTHEPSDVAPLIESNIHLGVQLIEAMAGTECRRLITLGTFFQYYGQPDYRPVNLYAATKQAFEDILAYYEDAHGIEAAKLVLFDVYGEGDPRRKLMAAIRDAARSGRPLPLPEEPPRVDLVHVDDVVDALIKALDDKISGGPYAISGGPRHSLEDVISTFERIGGKTVERQRGAFPLPPRNPHEPWSGPNLPGWRPRVSLEEGVRRLLDEEPTDAH